jgi:hypothetical protein
VQAGFGGYRAAQFGTFGGRQLVAAVDAFGELCEEALT